MTLPARRFLLPLFLACAAASEAAPLALYATPTSTNGTNAAAAVPNLATVSVITGAGLSANGTGIATRDAFGTSQYITGSSPAAAGGTAGDKWLWNNNQNWVTGGTPVPESHYYQFSLTADAGSRLDLTTLNFNWQAAINNNALTNTFSYQVFYSTDGTTYTPLGSVGTKLVGNDLGATVTDWGTISAENVDLTGIADTNTITFRIVLASSSTTSTGSFAFFFQNIIVNGVVATTPHIPGFTEWAAGLGVTGGANGDFDHDGIPNAVEYLTGSDPKVANASAVSFAKTGENYLFTFQRVDSAETPDAVTTVEVGTDLATWPDVFQIRANTATSSPGVEIDEAGTAPDIIRVTIPAGSAGKKFARLKIAVMP